MFLKNTFFHPGTMMSPDMTFTLKNSINNDIIRKKAFQKLKNDTPLSYVPQALEVVNIDYGGTGVGHNKVIKDGEMAYQFALMYWATYEKNYGLKALDIIRSWANKNKVFTGNNAPLEAAWSVCSMARAAELLKYTKNKEVTDLWNSVEPFFYKWLDTLIIPLLNNKYVWSWKPKNNWHYSMLCAKMQIAILREDQNEFNNVIKTYHKILPTSICIDHPCHTVEIKRDVTHNQFLLGGILQLAEMAYHQGIKDLYDIRLHPILEYCAAIMLKEIPEGIKKEEIKTPYGYWNEPIWELGYAHFNERLKLSMPKTEKILNSYRPERVTFHWGGCTLTHKDRVLI